MNKSEYPLYECGFEVQPTWDNVYFIKAFDFFRRFASRLKINPPSFYEFENAMRYDKAEQTSLLVNELFYSMWKAINAEHRSGQYLFYLFRGRKIRKYEWPTIFKMSARANPKAYWPEGLDEKLSSIVSLDQFHSKSFEFKCSLFCDFINVIAMGCKNFASNKRNITTRPPGMLNINTTVQLIQGEVISGNQYRVMREQEYDIVVVATADDKMTYIATQEEFQKHYKYAREEGIDLAYFQEMSKLKIPKEAEIKKYKNYIMPKLSMFNNRYSQEDRNSLMEDEDTLEKISKKIGFEVLGHFKDHGLDKLKEMILEPEEKWYQKMEETEMHYIDFDREAWIEDVKKAGSIQELANAYKAILEYSYQPHYQERPKTVRGILKLNTKFISSESLLEQVINIRCFSRFQYEIVKYEELARTLLGTKITSIRRTRSLTAKGHDEGDSQGESEEIDINIRVEVEEEGEKTEESKEEEEEEERKEEEARESRGVYEEASQKKKRIMRSHSVEQSSRATRSMTRYGGKANKFIKLD